MAWRHPSRIGAALAAVIAVGSSACAPERDSVMGELLARAPVGDTQAIHEVCPDGPTTFGIDVSKWQGAINWAAAAGDGVKFAIVRVSDGLGYNDEYFDANWAGTKENGIIRGTYQFFRSDEDPIAQADLLLERMGALEPGDLPPVADVESTDGVGNAERANRLRQWLEHVEQALGVRPIIYSGGYFWQDNVGEDFSQYPLWHAGYTGGSCPSTVADQWPDWTFWQFSSSGSVAGISGNVDSNNFNGDESALLQLTAGEAVCGDGSCNRGETHDSCASDCPICEPLKASGGVISEDGPCFTGGGDPQYLRHVADAGEGDGLIWTHTTDDAAESNFGHYQVLLEQSGRYRLSAFTAAAYAQSTQARYIVHHGGADEEFRVNQTAADGWNVVAELDLLAGEVQSVHVPDNTGEALSGNVQLVYDALKLERLDLPAEGEGEGEGDVGGEGEGDDHPIKRKYITTEAAPSGCAAAGSPSSLVGVLLLLVVLRGRRRTP